jgi:hypothetical protein
MISFSVIAAPRRVNYLGESLASFRAEWGNVPVHVYEEPGTSKYIGRNQVIVHNNYKTFGCVGNWCNAVLDTYNTTNTPYIMIMEDDILWMPNAASLVNQLLCQIDKGNYYSKDRIGFISPYCSLLNRSKSMGWQEPTMPPSGWCGSLCFLMPREAVIKIINAKEKLLYHAARYTKTDVPKHLDYAVAHTFQTELKCKLLTHGPTLIQHLGLCSTIPGNDFNNDHPSRQPFLC